MNALTRLQAAAACLILVIPAGCERGDPPLGQRIFNDGIGVDGRIGYTQGPDWLRHARSGCAVCHGNRGQGMAVQAGGITGVAPAVNWPALTARGYDETTLRNALVGGFDPHGRELHYYMPRWELTDAEFDALVTYLRSL